MSYEPRPLKQTETTVASIRLRNAVLAALEGIDEEAYSESLSYDPTGGLGMALATGEAQEYDPDRKPVRYGIRKVLDEMCADAQALEDKKQWVIESGGISALNMYENYKDDLGNAEKILHGFLEQYPGAIGEQGRRHLTDMIMKAREAGYRDYGQHLLDEAVPPTSSLSL